MQIVVVVVHALISIHALLAESDVTFELYNSLAKISIHALLAESEPVIAVITEAQSISIHALLAESDSLMLYDTSALIFLSTLSLRRAI